MKTFIYCRVSSVGQKDNYSFAAQKADGISFTESIGSEYRLYKDVESGAKSSRKDWARLKVDLESLSEPNDVIWYGSQSRLTRDAEEFQVFMKICIDRKLRLFEKTENRYIDFGKSSGDRIVGGIKSIIATEERLETARRTREGREDSYDEGLRNHNRTFGYKTVFDERGNKRYEIVPEQEEVIKKVFSMYAKGSTIYGIVKRLNESVVKTRGSKYWDNTKVKKMLGHIVYTGRTFDSKRNIIPSKKYPPIIDVKLFDSVGMLVERKLSGIRGRPAFYEGSGLMKCKLCEAGYHFHKMRGFNYYIHNDSGKCEGAKVRVYEIVNYILADGYATALLNYPKSIFTELKERIDVEEAELKSRVKNLDIKIKEEEGKVRNFTEAVSLGKNIAFYNDLIEKSLRELSVLKSNKVKFVEEISLKSKDLETIYSSYSLENLTQYFEATEPQSRKEMLKRIFKTVLIDKDIIRIDLIDGRKIGYSYSEIKSKWQELDYEIRIASPGTWKTFYKPLADGSQEEKVKAIKSAIEHYQEYYKHKRIEIERKFIE